MFEEEAKEYTHTKHCEKCSTGHCEKKCILVKDDYEAFKDGVEFGYNKANEWHYVKNRDLPKHEVNVLVLYDIQCIGIAHYNYDYKEWHFADSIVHDVIAWKEIELPELKEDEIESEMFPEIILPEGSSEFIDKVIADAEKRVKGSE